MDGDPRAERRELVDDTGARYRVGADPNYRVDEVDELAEVLGAQLAVIDGVGHPAYFEDPKTFNRMVHAFLQSCGWA